jgi:hypothetical protein
MVNNFSSEYAQLSDGELLHLASDRDSLTPEATRSLDAELELRHLTESDRIKHQQSVVRMEKREAKRRRRKIFGPRSREPAPWLEMFCALIVFALLWIVYIAIPSRFHMKADWEQSLPEVLIATFSIAVVSRIWWRRIAFWFSLVVSSTIHLVAVHAWRQRFGDLSRGRGKLAVLGGLLLFGAVYGLISFLRRNFYGDEAIENS